MHYAGWICRGGCRVDTAEVTSGTCGRTLHSFPLVVKSYFFSVYVDPQIEKIRKSDYSRILMAF